MKEKKNEETNHYLLLDPVPDTGVGSAGQEGRSSFGFRQTWAGICHNSSYESAS